MKISSAFTSLALKIVGGVIVVSSLFDFIFLAIPFQWQESAWQINLTNQIVDRGIVPMVGMAFLISGWWIADNMPNSNAKSATIVRLPVFFLASILGLMFLLLVPLHLGNINEATSNALERINAQSQQQEQRIQGFIQQLNAISQNPQQMSQAIAQRNQVIEARQINGRQLTEQQLQVLRTQRDQLQQILDLSQKPEEFKQKIEELKGNLGTQLGELSLQSEKQAKTTAMKQSLNIGISSLMLAIGYSVIGWFGLKSTKVATKVTEKA